MVYFVGVKEFDVCALSSPFLSPALCPYLDTFLSVIILWKVASSNLLRFMLEWKWAGKGREERDQSGGMIR